MPNIQIKNVPSTTHAVLRERAANQHQSLQEFLLEMLIAEASQPSLEEVFTRASRHRGGSVPLTASVDAVARDRASR